MLLVGWRLLLVSDAQHKHGPQRGWLLSCLALSRLPDRLRASGIRLGFQLLSRGAPAAAGGRALLLLQHDLRLGVLIIERLRRHRVSTGTAGRLAGAIVRHPRVVGLRLI